MNARRVDEEVVLVRYCPNYKTALVWYQDPVLCKQVDDRDEVYDLPLLKQMYQHLNQNGQLFYIRYKNRLCGDICLKRDGELCIVVASAFQNQHIGRRVIREMLVLAKESGLSRVYARIYGFNHQSQKMFESMGFQKMDGQIYLREL